MDIVKLQILGSPRSGTTSLYEGFRDCLNYSLGIFEPINPEWNYKIFPQKIQTHLDIINNCSINVIEKNVLIDFDLDKTFNFYINYLSHFDKIIFLCRKNIKEQAKSLKISSITNNWHFPYKDINVEYNEVLSVLNTQNQLLLKLSKYFKIPITYYEDLYSNNLEYIDNFLKYYNIKLNNLNSFYNKLNPKYRLKQ